MTKTRIVISLAGGNVNGVFTDGSDSEIYLIDYDNLIADPQNDCRQQIKTGTLDDFRRVVASEAEEFPSAKELLDCLYPPQ